MEPFRSLPLREHRRGGGVAGNCSAASAKVANAPHCRQARAVLHRVGTLNGRNHRFTVDLSGARPRHRKSEFLSIFLVMSMPIPSPLNSTIRGNRVLVKSGTSEYGIGAERLRQRGTAAHNTLVIEGQDSSEVLVGLPRCASCAPFIGLSCRSVGGTAIVECSHDGYRRLRRGQRLTTLMEWD